MTDIDLDTNNADDVADYIERLCDTNYKLANEINTLRGIIEIQSAIIDKDEQIELALKSMIHNLRKQLDIRERQVKYYQRRLNSVITGE